jgi:hypothetical protein
MADHDQEYDGGIPRLDTGDQWHTARPRKTRQAELPCPDSAGGTGDYKSPPPPVLGPSVGLETFQKRAIDLT